VSKLTKDLNCVLSFYPNLCTMQALNTGEVIGIGKEEEGLYILKHEALSVAGAVVTNNRMTNLKFWHLRLGHPSVKVMKHISILKNKVDVSIQEECMICPLAKQCRLKFPSSITKSSSLFQLMHMDVWGPHQHPTYDRKHYFLTIVDDYSRFTWVSLLQSKKEVGVVLKSFFSMICNQFGCSIKTVRSENSTEFFNSQVNTLFSSLGIVHQSSCPYTPQQNGVVERKHRHILEVGRALKLQSHVPSRFWGDCIQTAVYLLNRLPTGVLDGQSPYEVLFGKPPSIEHIKVFGCLCFASTLPRGDKFEARAK